MYIERTTPENPDSKPFHVDISETSDDLIRCTECGAEIERYVPKDLRDDPIYCSSDCWNAAAL